MLYLPPAMTCAVDEVRWILFSEYAQRRVEFVLLQITVGSEVSAGCASRYQILARKEGQRSCVIVVAEVDLSQPKCVGVAVYGGCRWSVQLVSKYAGSKGLLVRARILSPT